VLVALTHAIKDPFATIDALGIPNATTSPSAAPVSVNVRSAEFPCPVFGKSRVAEPDSQ